MVDIDDTNTLLWYVDLQNDFVDSNGALPVPGAEAIRDNVLRLTDAAVSNYLPRVLTGDAHYKDDPEIDDEDPDLAETFPMHCPINDEGSALIDEVEAWGISRATHGPEDQTFLLPRDDEFQGLTEHQRQRLRDGEYNPVLIRKNRFNVFEGNEHTDAVFEHLMVSFSSFEEPTTIVVFGVSGNVCVMHAINELIERQDEHNFTVLVVEDAVASLPPEGNLQPWDELKQRWAKQGVTFATTDEVVEALS